MGKKNASQIEDDIYNALVDVFHSFIGGTLYKENTRPLDASTEDAVIIVSGGDAEQVQTGRVHINIYVPDINNRGGNLVPDKDRLTELSANDEAIVKALDSSLFEKYSFRLYKMTKTFHETDINQHFVNVNLEFEIITF